VILRGARTAAAALAAAALLPWPATADPLLEAEREAIRVEERLTLVEAQASRPDEPAALRAARQFADGETQVLLGDWEHAAILLSGAVDDASFRATREYAPALFYLADALRRQGACGTARAYYDAYLALDAPARRGEALAGAIECGLQEGRPETIEPLAAAAERAFADGPPPEVRYLAAKALYARRDLPADERRARAMAAFEAVPPPYRPQAAYFQGVLQLERGDVPDAIARFELCVGEKGGDARQREVQDLCALALGRIHADLGRGAEALGWYARVPLDSPHFTDATYESAWALVRAGQHEAALRTASIIADLSPGSPLAPEATVLEGHLLLRLGRYAEATEAYSRVINGYAPVRDELDAILGMPGDPVRYFDELVGANAEAFDASAALPAVAVRWAATQSEVAGALALSGDLDRGLREVDASNALADRIDALLAHGDGLDAFPALLEVHATAQAVENAATALEGAAADAVLAALGAAVTGQDRGALDAAHAARGALEQRLARLPRSVEGVRARAARLRARLEALEREAFRLGYRLEGELAAVRGAERWLEQHRAEIAADADARAEFTEELRKRRGIAADLQAELRVVRQDVALARDAAVGADALADEARLRVEHARLVARERALLDAHRAGANAGDVAAVDRADALAERLASVRARAAAVAGRISVEASRRAGELRARVAAEKTALAAESDALVTAQAEARTLVGRIAQASFTRVRGEFYRLVLKADVGLVDVAWARKRVRLEKIQQLSRQKGEELKALDEDYGVLLREVD
jgi:tetratricopeptide (TPR) repeat protein